MTLQQLFFILRTKNVAVEPEEKFNVEINTFC